MAVFQPRFKDPKTGTVRKTRVWLVQVHLAWRAGA